MHIQFAITEESQAFIETNFAQEDWITICSVILYFVHSSNVPCGLSLSFAAARIQESILKTPPDHVQSNAGMQHE